MPWISLFERHAICEAISQFTIRHSHPVAPQNLETSGAGSCPNNNNTSWETFGRLQRTITEPPGMNITLHNLSWVITWYLSWGLNCIQLQQSEFSSFNSFMEIERWSRPTVVSSFKLWILGCVVALPTSGVDLHYAAEHCDSKNFLNLCDGQFCRLQSHQTFRPEPC